MKKIFTLISMALVAMSMNAQNEEPKLFEAAEITMGDITWKNGNNKTDINDEAGTMLYFVMGQGNAYEHIYAEEIVSNETGEIVYRPYYTYTDYVGGEAGLPSYGLYYKFTPKVDGSLKFLTWINKGNRNTVVVPASTGRPLTYGVDYQFEGYVNGQKANYLDRPLYNDDGTPKLDNDKNQTYEQYCIFFTAEEMLARHNAAKVVDGVDTAPYVLEAGNQPLWGWILLDVNAGESYYIFQLSSQLGFGGYDFTPTGGSKESYTAALDMGGTIMLNTEFSSIVDENGVAQNVGTTGRSVVTISTPNMDVEGVGSATPTAVVPGAPLGTGIAAVKAAELDANAPMYNLAGQKVANDFKGMVIQNGRKFMNK